MKKISIVLFVLCFSSCTSCVENITIHNLSDTKIIVCYTCADTLSDKDNDSIWNVSYKQERKEKFYPPYPPFIYYDKNIIEADSTKYIHFLYKNQVDKYCRDGFIKFFFIDEFVFSNYSLDTIAKYHLYEKKIMFSDEDLKNINWTIEYK